jgi:hypothetical protein
MKHFFLAFSVFLVWSFFGLWLYSLFPAGESDGVSKNEIAENIASDTATITSEPIKSVLSDEESKSSVKTDSLDPRVSSSEKTDINTFGLKGLNDIGDVIFIYAEGISILENSSEIFIPETIKDFADKTEAYLLEHPDKEVHINSLYSATENFESPNLGVKRGDKIMEALILAGIPKEKIVVKPIIKSIDFSEEGVYNNGISIFFKPLDRGRIAELKTKLPDKKIVYPRFSTNGILINNNLKVLLEEVKQVVKANPDVRIELIGHTDNIGNSEDNYTMGLNYSKQVEWYLVAKGGIANSKIKSSSKGEEEPIDNNKTEKGRITNRRVEVVFY